MPKAGNSQHQQRTAAIQLLCVLDKWQRSGREVAEKWQDHRSPQILTASALNDEKAPFSPTGCTKRQDRSSSGLPRCATRACIVPLEHPATSWHIPAKSRLLHVRSIPSRSTGTGLLHALHGRVALHGQERLLEWKTCALNLLKQRTEVLIRMILLDCVTHQHLHYRSLQLLAALCCTASLPETIGDWNFQASTSRTGAAGRAGGGPRALGFGCLSEAWEIVTCVKSCICDTQHCEATSDVALFH